MNGEVEDFMRRNPPCEECFGEGGYNDDYGQWCSCFACCGTGLTDPSGYAESQEIVQRAWPRLLAGMGLHPPLDEVD